MLLQGKWQHAQAHSQLENLILIRICNIEPGQHMPMMQSLLSAVSGSPSDHSCYGGSETFSAVTSCFFSSWPPFQTTFKPFIAFNSFFLLQKQDSWMYLSCLTKVSTATSRDLAAAFPSRASVEGFSHMVTPSCPPTSSWSKPAYISSFGLWQEAWKNALHRVTADPEGHTSGNLGQKTVTSEMELHFKV